MTADAPPRDVVIVDDHPIARGGLRSVIESLPRTRIVAEGTNGLEAIALARLHRPALITLDAGMPVSGGMEAFAEIRNWAPETRICLVTGFTASGLAAQWLQAGVDGILLKSCAPEVLAEGLSVLLDGGRFVAPEVEAAFERPSGDGLSLRERQVLHLIVEGLTNAQIGDRLSISSKTVDNHRTRMMAKLGVRSTAQLLAMAVREGLLEPTRQS